MKITITLLTIFALIQVVNTAQNFGDAITIQSFDCNSETRDTTVNFPTIHQ